MEHNFVVYRSSAGSGKTYTLVREYLKLVLLSESPYRFTQILAITFTNKAANEMKERVIEGLKELSLQPGDPDFEVPTEGSLFKSLQQEVQLSEEALREKATNILEKVLHNYADLAICTIDKFVHRIIRTFARDLRIPLDFDVEIDQEGLLGKAIDLLIAQVGMNEQLTKVLVAYTEQKASDDKNWHIDADLYAFARNLLNEESHAYLHQLRELSIDDFLTVRSTVVKQISIFETTLQKTGKEALELIQQQELEATAFAGGRNGIVKYFEYLASLRKDKLHPSNTHLKNVEENKWHAGKASAAEKMAIDRIQPQLETLFRQAHQYVQEEGQQYQLYVLLNQHLYSLSVLNEVEKMIDDIKESNNILLISDFNKTVHNIVLNDPVPFIYERLGERYQNYLIDEFQDTSVVQWQNLLPLVDNAIATGNFNMIVGDGKQAIYRWRNGEVEQFARLPEIYGHNNEPFVLDKQDTLQRNYAAKVLATNYRSNQEVIEFNNFFFREVAQQLNEHFQSIYHQLEQQVPPNKTGGYVHVRSLEDEEFSTEELHFEHTRRSIEEAVEDGYSLSDVTIIVRKNTTGSLLANYLIGAGIPVVSSESLLLKNSADIQFFINIFKHLRSPGDNLAKVAALRYLMVRSKQEERLNEVLAEYTEKESEQGKPHVQLNRFLKDHGYNIQLYRLIQLPIYQAVEELLRTFFPNVKPNAYLQFFMDAVHQFTARQGNNIFEFLDWWKSKEEKLSVQVPEGMDAVRIMTIHKSKGLQFPVVIVPFANWSIRMGKDNLWVALNEPIEGMDVALLSTNKSMLETAYAGYYEEEEHKSLLDHINMLYVAFTRAKNRLYVLTNPTRGKSVATYINAVVSSTPEWSEEAQAYAYGKRTTKTDTPKTQQEQYPLTSMHSYPWTDKLKVSLQAPQLWNMETFETQKQYGALLHTALAKIRTRDDVGRVLEQLCADGLIAAQDVEGEQNKIESLLANPAIGRWFEAGLDVRTEVEIIADTGEVFRPDRVVVDQQKAVVIDYKTGVPKAAHKKQVATYGKLLQAMGYTDVEQYLVYTEEARIEQV